MPIIDKRIKQAIRMAELLRNEQEGEPLSPDEEEALRLWKTESLFVMPIELNSREKTLSGLKELEPFADDVRMNRLIAITDLKTEEVVHANFVERKHKWWLYAAVLVPFIIAAVLWWFVDTRDPHQNETVIRSALPLPASASATLTLSNNTRVLLTTDKPVALPVQAEVEAVNSGDGSISYSGEPAALEGDYNTIQTSRGGYYQVHLSDGTRVWLNSSSAISFPVPFSEKVRNVRISGEVYFQVAANGKAPFIVKIDNGPLLTVLGTRFNVVAYNAIDSVKTTLLEGALKISTPAGDTSVLLKPGEQAIYKGNISVSPSDTTAAAAWKNGYFHFQGRSFEECMQDVARWYNVEVIYPSGIPAVKLWGEIDRQMPFDRLLSYLKTAGIRYRLENNKRLIILR